MSKTTPAAALRELAADLRNNPTQFTSMVFIGTQVGPGTRISASSTGGVGNTTIGMQSRTTFNGDVSADAQQGARESAARSEEWAAALDRLADSADQDEPGTLRRVLDRTVDQIPSVLATAARLLLQHLN